MPVKSVRRRDRLAKGWPRLKLLFRGWPVLTTRQKGLLMLHTLMDFVGFNKELDTILEKMETLPAAEFDEKLRSLHGAARFMVKEAVENALHDLDKQPDDDTARRMKLNTLLAKVEALD